MSSSAPNALWRLHLCRSRRMCCGIKGTGAAINDFGAHPNAMATLSSGLRASWRLSRG